MKTNKPLSFVNINFKIILILTFIYLLLVLFFIAFPPRFNWVGGAIGALIYLLISSFIHPFRYVIDGDKLIFINILRKNKAIDINTIIKLNISNVKWMLLSYTSSGFDTASSVRLRLKENEMKLLQSELLNCNPKIEVVYN